MLLAQVSGVAHVVFTGRDMVCVAMRVAQGARVSLNLNMLI
jgi:hypothetical protein